MQNHQSKNPIIEMRNAGVRRNGRWLVRNIDLEVHAGEVVTLVGPNGSGKSTTAKLALGILAPDEGDVIRSREISIGYVPQKISIDWSLPLDVRRLITLTNNYSNQQIEDVLEQTGISGMESAQVQSLSGGEFQRALMARAIIAKPKLLVLDEPVQGVDFTGEAALYELINTVRDVTGCGILLVSHDLNIVMAKTDRVICLNGHVCCTGTPERVSADPEYIRLFGEQAAQTLALYRHQHDHTHLPDGTVLHGDGTVSDDCHSHHTTPDDENSLTGGDR